MNDRRKHLFHGGRPEATRPARIMPLVIVLAVTAGCGEIRPYIYKAREFDRQDKEFNQPISDRSRFTICYNGLDVSEQRIAEIAAAECAKFGKNAIARATGFGRCPLLTPTEADFACVVDAGPPTEATPVSGTP